ncbi:MULTISPECIES: ectonucleotide pyrophosphatase/phosphodiesterase [unclassified Pseudoalteromonas]|uniref:alkaline phosphatase family protein n=1 Tax=unclassified Pseudoalteromonas TaxID=194690 RepID=UPI000B3C7771|nr:MULTISPECIES: ectonucleotide pyrophosphatase/phosphodiesterase [unclassified Pseudoalteromonas]MDN3379528.1 ectonucleotide pyrophosphatase/phosphodiesterase [Pseudoalteromonas sp. APC 3893]MDN3387868.1 ectonucleotide pyrophosphatase/phosphodiesterase [Pseudoalteromonas sp. APC 4017]OUS70018.1 alkaline phosphatase family protein [Pseudoalteromonas sp. A601]
MRLLSLIFVFIAITSLDLNASDEQTVVLISLDGFRWDYIEKHNAKNIAKIAEQGVRGRKMRPVYPTKTFPNHLSIITGLLPINHGVVDNRFCDSERNECYSMGKGKDDSTWFNGIPLWNLASMQGLKSATYFWPESDARFNGMLPDYYYHYSKHSDYQNRVDQIVQWLTLPKAQRPRLVVSYFSLVDSMGHKYGPDAEQTKQAVHEVDALMGQLQQRLDELEQGVNLVIVSDHGMSAVAPEQSIAISSLPSDDKFMVKNTGPRVLIYANENTTAADISTYKERLNKAAKGRYTVLTDSQRAQYHYQNNGRTGDIILQTTAPKVFSNQGKVDYLGTHGFAYTDDMAATFIAMGPAFKEGITLNEVNNLDIYPMITKILGIQLLSKIDGDGSTLWPALK